MEKLEAKTLCISNHAKSSLPFVTIVFEFLKILNGAIIRYNDSDIHMYLYSFI